MSKEQSTEAIANCILSMKRIGVKATINILCEIEDVSVMRGLVTSVLIHDWQAWIESKPVAQRLPIAKEEKFHLLDHFRVPFIPIRPPVETPPSDEHIELSSLGIDDPVAPAPYADPRHSSPDVSQRSVANKPPRRRLTSKVRRSARVTRSKPTRTKRKTDSHLPKK